VLQTSFFGVRIDGARCFICRRILGFDIFLIIEIGAPPPRAVKYEEDWRTFLK
jgi:hypothetical protein